MNYRPNNCMKCGGKMKKMQPGGTAAQFTQMMTNNSVDTWEADAGIDAMFAFDKFRPNRVLSKDNIPPSTVYDSQGRKIGVNDSEGNITRNKQEGPEEKYVDWRMLLNSLKTGAAYIGNQMENKRQDQYRYNQMAQLGRPSFVPNEDYQPNPFSLYARYGGSLKKYQLGGAPNMFNGEMPNFKMKMRNGKLKFKGYPSALGMFNMQAPDPMLGLKQFASEYMNPEMGMYQTGEDGYLIPSFGRMQEGGRLVQQVPQGYNKVKTEGNREFYEMQQQVNPAQLKRPAGPIIPTDNPAAYEQSLIKKYQSGYNPELDVQAGLLSKDRLQEFMPYYKRDLVYTETQPQQPVQPTVAFDGNPVFEQVGLSNRLVGFSRYKTRNSPNQSTPGNEATAEQIAEFMFANEMGKPTGEMYSMPGTEWSNTFTGGSNFLRKREGLDQYKVPSVAKFRKGGKTKWRGNG